MISREEFNHYLAHHEYDKIAEFKVDNAILLAAGLSSRFKPISDVKPKGLCVVKGEILIERQIRQLQAAGINDITVVVGYKKEMFAYLKDKFNVKLVENDTFLERNNTGSLILVTDILKNSYICSADNYFTENVFEPYVYHGYYSTVYVAGQTDEWCVKTDDQNIICEVTVGGQDTDVMLGHVYFDKTFSSRFVALLQDNFDQAQVKQQVWEYLYLKHLDELKLEVRRFAPQTILEFDSVSEAIAFDPQFLEMN